MIAQPDKVSTINLIRKYAKKVDATAICDADKNTRVMSSAIKCRSKNPYLCGTAFTVRSNKDFFPVTLAIENASPGDIIVVDGGGEEIAYGGEIFAKAMQGKRLGGIIVDGGYRDIGFISSCNLPVFSRYVTPKAGSTNQLGGHQINITCGGVNVSPGDIVISDPEGIVVLDKESALQTLKTALKIKETEARVITKLNDGKSLVECLNINEHKELLVKRKASKLKFTV